MALIKCPECMKEVSDKAPTCPNCGSPIAAAKENSEVGVNLTTIQGTSKRLKSQILISVICIIIGIIWLIGSLQTKDPSPWPGLLIFGGLVGFIVTRFRVWWHHK